MENSNTQSSPSPSSPFKCGGLLGSVLELARLSGVDEKELHAKDEDWWERLKK